MSEKWMRPAGAVAPYSAVFRAVFTVSKAEKREIEFSADERAQLYLDGVRVAEGPERGTRQHWYSGRVTLDLTPGEHTLTARVFVFDKLSPTGAFSLAPGFMIRDFEADWRVQMEKMEYEAPFPDWGSMPRVKIGTDYNNDVLKGQGGEWLPVEYFEDDRELLPPALPPMRYEPVAIEKRSDTLYHFTPYTLAYAIYHFKGHGTVKLRWAEAPYDAPEVHRSTLKGAKNKRTGTYFFGKWDEFTVDGKLDWPALYWHAGHYVELEKTGDVEFSMECFKTGYPLPDRKFDDPLMDAAYRTLQCCSFETFMDCPFYEQLQYSGDTRIESLCIYSVTDDHRLPAKAIRLLGDGQLPDGSLHSCYPDKREQYIPVFMLIWVLATNDYCKRHGREGLVAEMAVKADKLFDYLKQREEDGVLYPKDGWNFIDWCENWDFGAPIGEGPNCVLNFFYVLALRAQAENSGNEAYAKRADELMATLSERFFDQKAGLYADYLDHKEHSEHVQTLAILAGAKETPVLVEALRTKEFFPPCSIYFSYYYLEVCRKFQLDERKAQRLAKYREMLDENLNTLPEEFGNPRSDCHAWSSHVLLELNQKD